MYALPCTLGLIEANPELRADTSMGLIVGRFNIHYEDFDDTTVSGKKMIHVRD